MSLADSRVFRALVRIDRPNLTPKGPRPTRRDGTRDGTLVSPPPVAVKLAEGRAATASGRRGFAMKFRGPKDGKGGAGGWERASRRADRQIEADSRKNGPLGDEIKCVSQALGVDGPPKGVRNPENTQTVRPKRGSVGGRSFDGGQALVQLDRRCGASYLPLSLWAIKAVWYLVHAKQDLVTPRTSRKTDG